MITIPTKFHDGEPIPVWYFPFINKMNEVYNMAEDAGVLEEVERENYEKDRINETNQVP